MFKRNIAMKIVSFSMALLIWFYATTEQKVEIRMKAVCEFQNLGESLSVYKTNSDTMDVLFKGKSRDFLIMNLLRRRPTFKINLSSLDKGVYKFTIDKESVRVEHSKNIYAVSVLFPKNIELEIDSVGKREIVVYPVITGRPSNGFTISGEVKVLPQKISVTGPKKMIDSLNMMKTEEISIDNCKKEIVKKTKLNFEGRPVLSEIKEVTVKIPIETVITKEFKDVPVIFVNKKSGISIEPDSVSVDIRISGPGKMLEELLAGEISPIIDISNIYKKGIYTVQITIPKQKYIEVLSINPQSIKLKAK